MAYGPLELLIGTWEGADGMDVAPEPDGTEHSPYFESIVFEPIGDVTNAEEQVLWALRYHQVVRRISNNEVFHNETGYLTWDQASGAITQSFTIPRGVAVIATGSARTDDQGWTHIELHADANAIAQAPFMAEKAVTKSFAHQISVCGDTLKYAETTDLQIYGREFSHTDANTLTRTTSAGG